MVRLALAIVVVTLAAGPARADDRANRIAAAKKLFDRHVNGGVDEGVGETWAKDGFAWFPGQVVVTGSDAVELRQSSWKMGPPYLGTRKVTKSVVGWRQTWGWIAADVVVTQRPYSDSSGGGPARAQQHHYHWLEVFVADGAGVKALALLVTDARPDAKLVAGQAAKPGTVGPVAKLLVSPKTITLAADAEVAVIGSSETEIGLGAAPAKKLLASWKGLELAIANSPKESIIGDLGIAMAEVDLELKGKPVRLRAMVVAHKVGADWQVVALHFGADSDFGDPKRE